MAFSLKFLTCFVLTVCIIASIDANLDCNEVSAIMFPCIAYTTGNAGSVPSAECCASVKQLNSLANSTPNRQTACRCLQAASKTIPGVSAPLSASLPKKCGVKVPYVISLKTDCKKVK